MDDLTFNVKISYEQDPEEELKEIVAQLPSTLISAMEQMGEEMKNSLRRHVISDVYGAYTPTEYIRRSENSGMGTPLSDMDANAHVYEPRAEARGVEVRGLLNFTYKPTGEHADSSTNPSPLDGDPLIGRIETGAGYATKYHQARPFWKNFVNEVIDDDLLARILDSELQMAGYELDELSHTEREANDGEY